MSRDLIPPHHPVITPDAREAEEHLYKSVPVGALIRTWYESYLLLPPPRWQITAFFTSDGERVSGRTSYRRPASLRAWARILPKVAAKWWKRWTA